MGEDIPLRACGPACPWPHEPHAAPEVEWIGDAPLLHGEREDGSDRCLCGHPQYMTCPRWITDGIASWTIERAGQDLGSE